MNINLANKIDDFSPLGITHKDNFLYVLNKETGADNFNKGFSIFKIDPATGNIVSKGYLPAEINAMTVKGLAFDSKYFWVYSSYSDYLVKFSITE